MPHRYLHATRSPSPPALEKDLRIERTTVGISKHNPFNSNGSFVADIHPSPSIQVPASQPAQTKKRRSDCLEQGEDDGATKKRDVKRLKRCSGEERDSRSRKSERRAKLPAHRSSGYTHSDDSPSHQNSMEPETSKQGGRTRRRGEDLWGDDDAASRRDAKSVDLFPSEEQVGEVRRSGRSAKLPRPRYADFFPDDIHETRNRHHHPAQRAVARRGEKTKQRGKKAGDAGWVCETPGCGQLFSRATDMRRHLLTACGGKDGSQSRCEDQAERFYCRTCDRYLSRSDALKRHQRTDECRAKRGLSDDEPKTQKR